MEDFRNQLAGMYIGGNRTGKTTAMKVKVQQYFEYNQDNQLVVFDPQRRFSEFNPDKILKPNEDWLGYLEGLKDALVVMDDYRALHTSSKMDVRLNSLFIERCFNNVEYIFACHNPSQVLTGMTYYLNTYFIFHTNTVEGQFEKKIPIYITAQTASKLVNKYSSSFGGKDVYSKLYPKFPHIEFDVDTGKCLCRNMDAERIRLVTENTEKSKKRIIELNNNLISKNNGNKANK